ncbi:MAG TPA: beta-ketoacyl-[acyl-carrier-protein] synthase II, partial [Actinobacteria bacterium]|nr:beta-ketoacyl-[acyl-carrier-protein] synthase II [Actinomycetota bacterium]
MGQQRRVVVTGLGLITALGLDLEKSWDSLVNGKSGVTTVERIDVSKLSCRIAAQINDFKPGDYIDPKAARRMDKFAQFAVKSSNDAVSDSELVVDDKNSHRVGVIVGSGIGGIGTLEQQHIRLLEKGADKVSPFLIPMMISNMAAAHVSIASGAKGPVSTTTTACAAGSNAIGDAFEIVKRGMADVMISGGSEAAITMMGMAGFSNMNAMSGRNDDPRAASRPFDRDRDGFVMGEGSGIIILEELEHALSRGARIYCEMFGYGMSGEAFHITAPEESGTNAARCMSICLEEGNISRENVDYINAHGTSTPLNDVTETEAIKKCFGKHAYKLSVSSTKSMTGHCLGASGAVEAVATIMAVNTDIIPPTINLDNP